MTYAGIEPAISWFVVKRLAIGPAGQVVWIIVQKSPIKIYTTKIEYPILTEQSGTNAKPGQDQLLLHGVLHSEILWWFNFLHIKKETHFIIPKLVWSLDWFQCDTRTLLMRSICISREYHMIIGFQASTCTAEYLSSHPLFADAWRRYMVVIIWFCKVQNLSNYKFILAWN